MREPTAAQDGDLYVFLRVQPHESFERDGKDVYCAIPISITQAALGADIVGAHAGREDGPRQRSRRARRTGGSCA